MAKSGVTSAVMSGGPHIATLHIRLDYEPPNVQLRELLVPFQDETAREIISVALKMLDIKEDERYKNLGLFKGNELLADTLPLQSECEESEEGLEGHFLLQRQASFARCVCGHKFTADELMCPRDGCGVKRPDRVGAVPEPAGYLVRHQFAVVLEQSNHGCTNFLRLATFLEKVSSLYSFEIAKPARSVKELELGDEMKEFMTAYAMTETLAITCCSLIKSFHTAVASTIVEPMMLHHSKQTDTLRTVEKQERAHRENLDKLTKLLAKEAIACDKELKALQAAVKEVKTVGQLQWSPQGWVDKSQGKDKVIVKMIQKEKLARAKAVKAFAAYEALFAKAREAENALYSYIPLAIKQARQVDRERLSLSKFYMTKFSTLFSTLAGSLKTMNMDPVLTSLSDDSSMQGCLDMWSRVLGEPPPLERIEFKLPCTSEHLARFDELHVGDPSELKLPIHLHPPVDTQQEMFRQFGTKLAVSVSIPQDYYTPAKQMEISQKIRAMDIRCRLMDYFLVFGRGALAAASFEGAESDFEQDLSLGNLSYEGVQLQHYPAWEWPDAPMPPNLPMFAFPLGVQLIVGVEGSALAHARRPRMFRFMCTKIDGARQHCSALVVYEKVSPKALVGLYDAKIKKLDEAIAHHAHLLEEKKVGILTDHRTRAMVEKLGAQIAEAVAAGQEGATLPLREQREKLIESLGGKLHSRRQQKAAEEAAQERLQEEREREEEEEDKRRGEDERRRAEDGTTEEKLKLSPTKSNGLYDDSPIVLGDVVELHGLNTETYNGQRGLVIAVYGNGRYDITLENKEVQRFKDANLRKPRGARATSPLRPKRIPPMPPGPPPPGPPPPGAPPSPLPFLPPPPLTSRTSQERSAPLSDPQEDVADERSPLPNGSKAFSFATAQPTRDFDLEQVAYEPKVLCLISSHPICEAMEGFLRAFHNARSSSSLPYERLVSNVMHEIPVPPRGKLSVRWQPEEASEDVVVISRAPTNKLPEIDCDFRYLFRTLDHDTIIAVFTAIATEQRVIFLSESLQMLVHVSETFLSLLFPFMWQGVYIPILPEALWDFLYAPVPFVAGIHSDVLKRKDVPEDVICVDLDKGELGPLSQPIPTLEPASARKLMAQLKKFADIKQKNRDFVKRLDDAFDLSHKIDLEMKAKRAKERKPGKELLVPFPSPRLSAETAKKSNHKELAALSQHRAMVEMEQRQNFDVTEIRQAFLRFWVKAFVKYSLFLKPWVPQHGEEETLEACFDVNKFIESSPAGARPVLSEICRTQMCWNFVAAKLDGLKKGASMPAYIRFFDECIVEKENRSSTKLVKDSTAFLHEGEHESVDIFDAPNPNVDHLGNTARQPWPLFDPKLFLPLRYVQPLAELESKKKQLETAWYDHSLLPHTPSQSEDVALEEAIKQHGPSRSRGSVVAKGQALAALFSQAISEREAIAAVTSLKEVPEFRRARRSTVWGGERPSVDPSAAVQLKAARAEIEELKKRISELEAKAKS